MLKNKIKKKLGDGFISNITESTTTNRRTTEITVDITEFLWNE